MDSIENMNRIMIIPAALEELQSLESSDHRVHRTTCVVLWILQTHAAHAAHVDRLSSVMQFGSHRLAFSSFVALPEIQTLNTFVV